MPEQSDKPGGDLTRALEALSRLEKAIPAATMRRTAAESGGSGVAGAASEEIAQLRAENESLRAELNQLRDAGATVRQDAAQMAAQVERALDQLDLIEKG